MTKTLTIHSCHIYIALWLIFTGLSVLPINYYNSIANSLDDDGCRLSYTDGEMICPNKEGLKDKVGNTLAVYKDTGKLVDMVGMAPKSTVIVFVYYSCFPLILIQMIAFISWNMHYKWINVNIKSCWPKSNGDADAPN